MNSYISLLRGINVSGQKKIKMAELKKLYESIGFKNVRTYIQSGNVIFDSEEDSCADLSRMISEAIQEHYGFTAAILIKKPEDFRRILDANPIEQEKIYITFLFGKPEEFDLGEFTKYTAPGDIIIYKDDVIYLYCPGGYGKSKLSINLFEKNSAYMLQAGT